ncbi:hypothetical protein TruAng_002100 [Truncatella angustata]|nr:hypothetical protein TruAng_002100 [Truncatella angustata]
MVSKTISAASLLCVLLQPVIAYPSPQQSLHQGKECPTGVQIIGVEGTGATPGRFEGLEDLRADLLKRMPGSASFALDYPASGSVDAANVSSYHIPTYLPSEITGVFTLGAKINTFTKRCPQTGIVLIGYSQGSHVIGDALCGFSGSLTRFISTAISQQSQKSIPQTQGFSHVRILINANTWEMYGNLTATQVIVSATGIPSLAATSEMMST